MYDYSNKTQYFNRELSWIEFNKRVLSEGLRETRPLLERLKFLAIVSSNFDEFFMVRVASLKTDYITDNGSYCQTGMSPEQQLDKIYDEYRKILKRQINCLHKDILPALAREGLKYVDIFALDQEQTEKLRTIFINEYFPLLTPVRVSEKIPMVKAGNMRLHIGFLLRQDGDEENKLSVVQLPASVKRIIKLPAPEGEYHFTLLEDLVLCFAAQLFSGYEIVEHLVFRITRDANFAVDEHRDDDFVEAMEEVLTGRLDSEAVRLNCSNTSTRIRSIIQSNLTLSDAEVFETVSPLEINDFMALVSTPGFNRLRDEPLKPIDLFPEEETLNIWDWIKSQDRILFHPFDSFSSVMKLLNEAAVDAGVMAIKMTLYRTSRQSPVVSALERAAENGKQVTVLIELKARFDEKRNIHWAERLERAGVVVVYGISELKVHAKATLIIRREEQGICRYLHISTGNYNERTAKLYTDIGLMTVRDKLCYEVGLVFNAITGYSTIPSLSILSISPYSLRSRILQLIQREIDKHSKELPARITAKINSLSDPLIIDALYKASKAGVTVDLNIRGICMLKPGVVGLSENIRVVSVVDRYLEHARALCFHNGGNPEAFISSADWMDRNLDRRVELLLPIQDSKLAEEVMGMIDLYMCSPAYELQANGQYRFVSPTSVPAQYEMYQRALKKKYVYDRERSAKLFDVRRPVTE